MKKSQRYFYPGECNWSYLTAVALLTFCCMFVWVTDDFRLPLLFIYLAMLLTIAGWGVTAFVLAFRRPDRRIYWIQQGLMNLTVLALVMIPVAFLPPVTTSCHPRPPSARCRSNLKQIGFALAQYGGDYDGRLPPEDGVEGLRKLIDGGYLTDLSCYICPAVSEKVPTVLTEENCGYHYRGGIIMGEPVVVVRDKNPVHDGCNMLDTGGHVWCEKAGE